MRALEPDGIRDGFSEAGLRLLMMIEDLDRPFGLERSAKLRREGVNTDRFLASLHKNALPGGPRRGLERIAGQMGLAGARLAALLERVEAADIVHFGHEGGSRPVRKIYLEFATAVRAARMSGTTETILVHESVKWRVDDPASALTTRYLWPGKVRSLADVEARLAGGGRVLPPASRLALEAVRLARGTPGAGLFYMDVVEEGTQRRSFDVNLYSARLILSDLMPAIETLAEELGLGSQAVSELAARYGSSALGHVSGGSDREGGDFATVYFGVEAREGAARA